MKRENLVPVLMAAVLVALAPETAFAADIGAAMLQKVIDLITGTMAHLVGLIMIISVGYSLFKGRMDWERAGCVIGGIVIIFAAADIYSLTQ